MLLQYVPSILLSGEGTISEAHLDDGNWDIKVGNVRAETAEGYKSV